MERRNESTSAIALANFFIYNNDYGLKEGLESQKIFYYHPADEQIEKQIRTVGFCAGVVKFTEVFNPSKPCEFVHTQKIRMILYQLDKSSWMVMGLHVPVLTTDKSVYKNDQISDHIYMSVLKQMYNYFKLFHGSIDDALALYGIDKLKLTLRTFFDNYIANKLMIDECDLMSTFSGIHFMSLDRGTYLKVQCLVNMLEESVPFIDHTVVMYNDQVIWSGLEQEDIALIYTYLKDLINGNATTANHVAKFLFDASMNNNNKASSPAKATTSTPNDGGGADSEFSRIYLQSSTQQFYLIPYNLAKLTFFLFVRVDKSFKLGGLNQIDDLLGSSMLALMQDISDQQAKINPISLEEKDIKYIYFNRLNLAQKSTLTHVKETPKYIINLISQLSKELESCRPTGEIFVKSGRDYWIACKKSDLREVYVIICQKNANLTLIDEEVKHLCSTNFSNILFME